MKQQRSSTEQIVSILLAEMGLPVADFRCPVGRAGHGIGHNRRHHRQGSPARPGYKRGTRNQAIGRSKDGMMVLTDALGNLVRFERLPGNRYGTIGGPPLIDGIEFDALLSDKAF